GGYTNDYVELFNRGSVAASIDGWSIQYASATGTGNFGATTAQITPLPAINVPAGGYVLVQEASAGAVGVPLPTPDVTDATPINMAATGGKVALVNTSTSLGCNGSSTPCPPAALAQIVDLVGIDGANFYEGSAAAPATSSLTAAFRKSAGCTDTDDNAADFETPSAPAARNSATGLHPCGGDDAPSVANTTPANNAAGVSTDATISITFSEPVDAVGGWYAIACSSSGAHAATVSGGPTTWSLDPTADFSLDETCTVTIDASLVTDQDTDDPPDAMAADYSWSFATAAALTPIHAIQGAAQRSPLTGTTVTTSGLVTAVATNGFYLQDPTPDADDATSEAIFVFTSTSPTVAVGDGIRVTANVSEFRPGGSSSANLTTTELTGPAITVTSTGNPLPAPVVIGSGGRVPPSTVIEDDATGSVETSGTFDPDNDGIDFYESLEGMRVQLDDAVVVGPTAVFGTTNQNREVPVLADGGANATVRTPRDGIVIRPTDFNPERIILNDLLPATPDLPAANVGDSFPGAALGVVDYSFGNFKLQVTSLPALASGGLARETTSAPDADQLSVATFNVENLDANDPAAKFDALAGLIVHNLRAPDVLSIEEVQDNDGATDDGVVAADETLQRLTDAVADAGGPAYEYRQISPTNDADGGEPGGNIRVVLLFRTDRGLTFIDRPGGTATNGTDVVGTGDATHLTFSPGRIDPTNAAFTTSRKPLAGEFDYRGHHLFVIGNHWNSKGGDDPLFGRFQPPTRSSEVQRGHQATIVHDFVASILAADAGADVVVLGDLNDFEFSDALTTLTAGGHLHDLVSELPVAERYSYVFEGNSQELDHILLSDNPAGYDHAIDPVHVNAEFADQASDHDPQVALIRFPFAPSITSLTLPTAPVRAATTVQLAAAFTDANPGDTHSASIDWGDGATTAGTVSESNGSGSVSGAHAYASPGLYTVALTVDDGSLSDSATYAYVLVYDPTAGFVTGSGTINSQAGAFPASPSLTGPAAFIIESKYPKNGSTPAGDTSFTFAAAGLSFEGTAQDWLVVSGPAAIYSGGGSLNGVGGYRFLVSAWDGDAPGGGGTDRLRIRIWQGSTVAYDNQPGAAIDAAAIRAISGGSIVVHKGK
ncbi:MAG TPA: Ig-like domain-containing protein, partial [Candidatus Acidoferrum sp.]|nr:Ig-like domain-containing protein [Candidatus Acidoferrum sp.]